MAPKDLNYRIAGNFAESIFRRTPVSKVFVVLFLRMEEFCIAPHTLSFYFTSLIFRGLETSHETAKISCYVVFRSQERKISFCDVHVRDIDVTNVAVTLNRLRALATLKEHCQGAP